MTTPFDPVADPHVTVLALALGLLNSEQASLPQEAVRQAERRLVGHSRSLEDAASEIRSELDAVVPANEVDQARLARMLREREMPEETREELSRIRKLLDKATKKAKIAASDLEVVVNYINAGYLKKGQEILQETFQNDLDGIRPLSNKASLALAAVIQKKQA